MDRHHGKGWCGLGEGEMGALYIQYKIEIVFISILYGSKWVVKQGE